MPVKKYDRKNKKFYIIKPKLVHIGNIKAKKINRELTDEEKYKVYKDVNIIEHLGTEFGAKTILSISDYDIFKIRDEIKNNRNLINKNKIKNISHPTRVGQITDPGKKQSNSIDVIKKQLGL